MSIAIRCHQLIKTYPGKPPVEAVRGLDLEVREGECFGFLGPNGAGKTTTIEILEGLLDATSGEVEILGKRWDRQANQIREEIGISLQETRLSEKLTVAETLRLFRSFYKNGIDVETAMKMVSLESKAKSLLRALSGGQKQRLAVATALVGDPKLLFLDEPTTGLDPSSRRQLWEIITSFRNDGKTVMLTTHYMDEAERLCDRVAIVDRGKVIALGTPRELISQLGGEHIIEFSIRVEQDQTSNVEAIRSKLQATCETLPHVTATQQSVPNVVEQEPQANAAESADENESQTISMILTSTAPHLTIPALLQKLQDERLTLAGLTTRTASLEDVFVNLTGRHLYEAQETNAA